MQKKLVSEKRDELKALDAKSLVDRILAYPDQDYLNYKMTEDSYVKRPHPIGYIARNIERNDYQMTDPQRYTLIHDFAKLTVPDLKVVGVTFRKNNANEFEKTLISKPGKTMTYETTYTLQPEPDNPHDENAVKVMVRKTDGELHQIGYLSRDFVAVHPIKQEMEVKGQFTDFSNGHFKNVSYHLGVDVEALHETVPMKTEAESLGVGVPAYLYMQKEQTELSESQLSGIGDLGLDKPEHLTYTYERMFSLKGKVLDGEKASTYLDTLNLAGELNDEFVTRNCETMVASITHMFPDETHAIMRVETDQPMTKTELLIANSWSDYIHDYGTVASHLKEQDFLSCRLQDNLFEPSKTGFHMVEDPGRLDLSDADFEGLSDPDGFLSV